LSQAYKNFRVNHPWADTDEIFGKISDAFRPGSSSSVNNLTNQLNRAAQDIFPVEYNKAVEDKIRGDIINEKTNLDAGDISGGGSAVKGSGEKKPEKVVKFFPKKEPIQNWYGKPEDKK